MSLSLALPHGGPRLVANARVDAAPSAAEVETDGSRLINASADDVLGLTTDARVKDAAIAAVRKFGVDVARSSTLVGQLEARVAAKLKADAAAVTDALSTVLRTVELAEGRRFVDARLASRLGGAGTVFSSVEQLARELAAPGPEQRFVVVEGVHPFEGDLAPLPRLVELAQRHLVPLVVIDPLGPGPLGATGSGVAEHFEVSANVELSVSALGPQCLAIAGPRAVVEAFLPTLPARVGTATTAAALKRLELLEHEPHRRDRAFALAEALHEALRVRGFDTGPSVTPWVPVWLGDEGLADIWLRRLAELGVFARALLDGPRSRLVLALSATTTDAQRAHVVDALERLEKQLGSPPPLGPEFPRAVSLARPGSFAIATPCHARWLPPLEPTAPTQPIDDARRLRERVLHSVETLTWRVVSGQSGQLRRLPGAATLRSLVDRARAKR